MTGRDLIMYILEHGLEDAIVCSSEEGNEYELEPKDIIYYGWVSDDGTLGNNLCIGQEVEMVKYFCDICNKDITNETQFNCAILYERKFTIYNHKIANRKDFCLCEECNNKMIEKIKTIL